MLRPQDEACKRWWEWKNGRALDVSIERMWEDFHSYRMPQIMLFGGDFIRSKKSTELVYKTMLNTKLKEVANELYDELKRLKK